MHSISRSHPYWGNRPVSGLFRVFEELRPGEVFLDPFCGGAPSIVAALEKGARVIGHGMNPMAVFLSKVLIQPVGVFALKEAFEKIRDDVAESIIVNYAVSCPKCGKEISFDYLKWRGKNGEAQPEAVKVTCNHCGLNEWTPLKEEEIERQKGLSRIRPKLWFPKVHVRSLRKTDVEFFHELFTGRNLTSLTLLHNAIDNISSERCKEALQYVFTATLNSCCFLQPRSKRSPSFSGMWPAHGFYVPTAGKEKNVWCAFEDRFRYFLSCKEEMNLRLPFVRLSGSMEEFEKSDDAAYIHEADIAEFAFPRHTPVSHVFIHSLFVRDNDYNGFSAFWGSWLGMECDKKPVRHPGSVSVAEGAEHLYRLLSRIRENTPPSCVIILTHDLKKPQAWELIREKVLKAGYFPQPTNGYSLLLRKEKRRTSGHAEFSKADLAELRFFLRAAAYLLRGFPAERITERASSLLRSPLQRLLLKQKTADVNQWISDHEWNRRSYNSLVFIFIKMILTRDGFRIIAVDKRQFDLSRINGYDEIDALSMPQGPDDGVGFVAKNDDGRRILFCFYGQSKVDALKKIAESVFKDDRHESGHICCLLVPGKKEMIQCRQVSWAANWPGGFFIEFSELFEKAGEIDNNRFGHLTGISPRAVSDFRSRRKIEHFNAKVLENRPVGGKGAPGHFLLRFEAPRLGYVVPGQFVMIDTLPCDRRKKIDGSRSFRGPDGRRRQISMAHGMALSPQSFLKRPFGIHRAYYKHFEIGHPANICLSKTLSAVARPVLPHKFEIFYKIIEDGTGTHELTTMKRGDSFKMLGPLGKRTDPAAWRSDGIEEVHLIGGGVGMAPLVFFGQALKYSSFRVKAFTGIDRIESLLYEPASAVAFGKEDPGKAYVYIDELRSIGLGENDIHVSFEKDVRESNRDMGLPERNLFPGLVSEHYKAFLGGLSKTKGLLVLACGPKPMLKAIEKICSKAKLPMKVLLEKRMGCGIGVCMSCVCPTKKNNVEQYARVCVEGPLFDSKDIDWERL